jgi:putative ABC transport system permease protein
MTHAFRSLAKSPGFTAVAVFTVAVGIASATAIYSVANAVVFRPLPFRDEASLAWIWSTRPDRDRAFFSIPDFQDLQRANTTTADLAAITPLGFNLTGLGEPERVLGWRVTANLFSLLGVAPEIGHLPARDDDRATAPATAVLGHGYWQRRFGGDPHVVGRVVQLNGSAVTIAGVLPATFLIPNWETDIVVVQSLDTDGRRAERGTNFLRAIARLKPGVTLRDAQAEFAALNQRLAEQYPDTNAAVTAPRFVALRDEVVRDYRASLLLLLGAAGALLLIMCANLAGLLAARGLARQRDAALCSALGASPARLLRAYLAEGFLLATAGGLLGVGACALSLDALLALAPADLPRATQVALDAPVIAFALGVTFLTGLGVGLAPAMRLARVAPIDILKRTSNATTGRRGPRGLLVSAQIALCSTLLVGTGLLVRSLRELLRSEPGFVSHNVLTAQVALPAATYRTASAVINFIDRYAQRLAALPGVQSVSVTHVLPLTNINTRSEFIRPDRPPAKPSDTLSAANRFIGEHFFATLGIALLAGRDFQASDDATGRPVVIIDQALAARHWPGEDPLGKMIRIRDGTTPEPRDLEIVGVVGATKNFSLEETGTPTLYLPARQMVVGNVASFLTRGATFVAKTSGDPLALGEAARKALRDVDAGAAVSIRAYDEAIAWTRARRVFNLNLLGFFSATAVLLAVIGLYAITAQAVTARTREIGIRMALGADELRIARHILWTGARLTVVGIASGFALAAALAPLFAGMLYGVRAFDPVTYVSVGLLLGGVGCLATWWPARRATQVDPVIALRSE